MSQELARTSNLRSSLSLSIASSFFYAGAQWAALVMFARALTINDMGVFAFWLSVITPFTLLTNLKLRAVIATDVANEFSFHDYLATRLLGCCASLVFVTVLSFSQVSPEEGGVILLIGLAKVLDSIADIIQGLLQQRHRHEYVAASKIVKGGLQVSFLLVAVAAKANFLFSVFAWMTSFLVSLLVCDLRLLRKVSNFRVSATRIRTEAVRSLVLVALPMGAATAIGGLVEGLPRYFIENNLGKTSLGYFAAIAALAVAGSTLLAALAQVAGPRLAALYMDQDYSGFDRLLRRLTIAASSLGFAAVAGSFVAGDLILRLVYGARFADHKILLVGLMIVFWCRASFVFFGTAIQAMRNFRVHYKIDVVNAILLTACLAVATPRYGLAGAIFSMLLVAAAEGILYYLIFRGMSRSRRPGTVAPGDVVNETA